MGLADLSNYHGISCCYNSLAALFSAGCTAPSGVLAHVTICVVIVLQISYSVTMPYMNNSYDIEEVNIQLAVEIT